MFLLYFSSKYDENILITVILIADILHIIITFILFLSLGTNAFPIFKHLS